jgi:hypothetical protein
MNVIINACYGGFGLSTLAVIKYYEAKGIKVFPYQSGYMNNNKELIPIHEDAVLLGNNNYSYSVDIYRTDKAHKLDKRRREEFFIYIDYDLKRHDETLVQIVQELGKNANSSCANLQVVEIADGLDYTIDEYDGFESITTQFKVSLTDLANGLSQEQLRLARKADSIVIK